MQTVLRASSLTALGFQHGSSTRKGGVSGAPFESLNLSVAVGDAPQHVAENQSRFAGAVGFDAARLLTLSQVHGRDVYEASSHDEPVRVRGLHGDALVAPAGVPIAVRTADCVPVLIVDPETRWVGAAHAGWRGVLSNVVSQAVERLALRSRAPTVRLVAAVFPHIRRCCFEVDDALAEQLSAAGPGAGQRVFQVALGKPFVCKPFVGKPFVALDAIVRAQLRAAGLPDAHIEDVPGCTCCDPERFFSYRRDGTRSGRHLTAVVG